MAIDACAVVIPLLTRPAASSVWVRGEITYADQQRKDFLPLMLEAAPPMIELAGLQYYTVYNGAMPAGDVVARLRQLCDEESIFDGNQLGPRAAAAATRSEPADKSADN